MSLPFLLFILERALYMYIALFAAGFGFALVRDRYLWHVRIAECLARLRMFCRKRKSRSRLRDRLFLFLRFEKFEDFFVSHLVLNVSTYPLGHSVFIVFDNMVGLFLNCFPRCSDVF